MTERGGKFSAKKKEKKVEGKVQEEKEKGMKDKEKGAKKPDKQVKKPENPVPEVPKAEEKKEEDGGTVEGAEARKTEENGDFKPIELPPFEIVTGERMSPFYFKFQFRNVEYSSGRNKTLLCFRVDLPGSATEPLMGYMEDEHTTAHAEEAFFQQVLPKYSPSQECEVTWYVSCSPCTTCATRLSNILRQHNKLRLSIFCSRLLDWEEPEVEDGLKALAAAGGKLRMMKPADFLHVWETYVEKDEEGFTPWDDCQDNYEYYVEKLAGVLK